MTDAPQDDQSRTEQQDQLAILHDSMRAAAPRFALLHSWVVAEINAGKCKPT